MPLPEILTDNPELMAALVAVLTFALRYQRGLGYSEYRQRHRLKVALAPTLHRTWLPLFVSQKGYRDDSAEYLQTWEKTLRESWDEMQAMGGSPHLINSIKSREHPNGETEYSDMHFIWGNDDRQTEIYLFDNGDGTVDVYGHEEDSVAQPLEHLDTSNQKAGDPEGVLNQ